MGMTQRILGAALAAFALPASAYCIHNDTRGRDIAVVQEMGANARSTDERFQQSVKPGGKACCDSKNRDCNPEGKVTSLLTLTVTVEDDANPLSCGPVGASPSLRKVKVTGGGTVRVVDNPRFVPAKKDTGISPYVARVWTHDHKDVTGPNGLPCR